VAVAAAAAAAAAVAAAVAVAVTGCCWGCGCGCGCGFGCGCGGGSSRQAAVPRAREKESLDLRRNVIKDRIVPTRLPELFKPTRFRKSRRATCPAQCVLAIIVIMWAIGLPGLSSGDDSLLQKQVKMESLDDVERSVKERHTFEGPI